MFVCMCVFAGKGMKCDWMKCGNGMSNTNSREEARQSILELLCVYSKRMIHIDASVFKW